MHNGFCRVMRAICTNLVLVIALSCMIAFTLWVLILDYNDFNLYIYEAIAFYVAIHPPVSDFVVELTLLMVI